MQKLGCDLILNSNAKEDKCRVCNGNGDTCRTHSGVNTEEGDGEFTFTGSSVTLPQVEQLLEWQLPLVLQLEE